MLYPVSIKGVLLSPEDKVVLLRNERDEWELPGGRLEPYETPQECLARECFEELNLQVNVGELLDVWLFEVLPAKHVLIVAYGCKAYSLEGLQMSNEHKGVGLFSLEDLQQLNLPKGYKQVIGTCLLPESAYRYEP